MGCSRFGFNNCFAEAEVFCGTCNHRKNIILSSEFLNSNLTTQKLRFPDMPAWKMFPGTTMRHCPAAGNRERRLLLEKAFVQPVITRSSTARRVPRSSLHRISFGRTAEGTSKLKFEMEGRTLVAPLGPTPPCPTVPGSPVGRPGSAFDK